MLALHCFSALRQILKAHFKANLEKRARLGMKNNGIYTYMYVCGVHLTDDLRKY